MRVLDAAGAEVTRGAEGEVCVRGANVTAGYLNNDGANAESFTRDGFFRTGDQGRVDADGYLFLTGRLKELINRGGEKISPVELDNVLARHEGVAEAVCFAVPDEVYGQVVGVAVVRKAGASLTAHDLRHYLQQRVAGFKVPAAAHVFFADTMPKTATGKVQRRMVAEAMMEMTAKGPRREGAKARL